MLSRSIDSPFRRYLYLSNYTTHLFNYFRINSEYSIYSFLHIYMYKMYNDLNKHCCQLLIILD